METGPIYRRRADPLVRFFSLLKQLMRYGDGWTRVKTNVPLHSRNWCVTVIKGIGFVRNRLSTNRFVLHKLTWRCLVSLFTYFRSITDIIFFVSSVSDRKELASWNAIQIIHWEEILEIQIPLRFDIMDRKRRIWQFRSNRWLAYLFGRNSKDLWRFDHG